MRALFIFTLLLFTGCQKEAKLEPVDTEGYKKTASGLQYKIIREGTGKKPIETNEVEVHYEGKLLNGKIFDSSYQRGETTRFPLNKVIKGWTEGLQLIKEGGEIHLIIPSKLAYGEQGAGNAIPPNTDLFFRVELKKIVK